ncbi:MAG: phosphatidylserine decarboxylase family protein [Deltaproteobacteria bacterium]|nr:MAG: phosphatidylserine decarboxylase family protein [Deltaproteobacteria bacterium]
MAKEGIPFLLIALLLALAARFLLPGKFVFPAFFLLFAAFVAFFFRDPERKPPEGAGLVVSPADGLVVYAGPTDGGHFFSGPAEKVSIFMSLFDVHVNRAPLSGVVEKIVYNKGKFFRADVDKASLENEQNWVIMRDGERKFAFVQIAGLVARRIVCKVREGDRLEKGQRVGLIMFGSRVDVYLPPGTSLRVRKGDRVRAGESVIGEL